MSARPSRTPPAAPSLLLMGLNHKTAPVALRECLAFAENECDAALLALKGCAGVREAMLVSTCNRVEVLVTTDDPNRTATAVRDFIAHLSSL